MGRGNNIPSTCDSYPKMVWIWWCGWVGGGGEGVRKGTSRKESILWSIDLGLGGAGSCQCSPDGLRASRALLPLARDVSPLGLLRG